MKRYFRVDQAIALQAEGYYYDLHNNYRFRSLALEIDADAKSAALMHFNRLEGDWIKPDEPEEITLVFDGLSYIEFSPDYFEGAREFVADIGFRDRKEVESGYFVMEEENVPVEGLDIVFFFEGGGYIQLHAEGIEVKVKKAEIAGVS